MIKKLELDKLAWFDKTLAKKINEIIDHLEASKGECKCFCHTDKWHLEEDCMCQLISGPSESKKECENCVVNKPGGVIAVDADMVHCSVCGRKVVDPPEHEESFYNLFNELYGIFSDLPEDTTVEEDKNARESVKQTLNKYLVSKEKIKRDGKQVLRTLSLLKLDWKDSKITEDEKLAFGLARDRAWTIVEGFIAGLGD